MRYCSYCSTEHELTPKFWTRVDSSPQCRKQKLDYCRDWRLRNPDKKYKPKNKEAANKYTREWRQRNREKCKSYDRNRSRPQEYMLALRLRQRLYAALRNQYRNGSAVRDLGCSIHEFKLYIESKFQSGMSWSNYGRTGWHIDHIKPLASFNLSNKAELRAAVHYTNLQPMWALDNLKKADKI